MEKQPLDELLRTYKVRVKVILTDMDSDDSSIEWREVLRIKLACYRTFIQELEEVMSWVNM